MISTPGQRPPRGSAFRAAASSRGSIRALIDKVLAARADEAAVLPTLGWVPATADLAGAEVDLVGSRGASGSCVRRCCRCATATTTSSSTARRRWLLTLNALCGRRPVLIPMQCEYYVLEGLSYPVQHGWTRCVGWNPRLELEGILPTMVDGRTNLMQQVEGEVRQHFCRQGLLDHDPAQRPPVRGAVARAADPALRRGLSRAHSATPSSGASFSSVRRRSPSRRASPRPVSPLSPKPSRARGLGHGQTKALGRGLSAPIPSLGNGAAPASVTDPARPLAARGCGRASDAKPRRRCRGDRCRGADGSGAARVLPVPDRGDLAPPATTRASASTNSACRNSPTRSAPRAPCSRWSCGPDAAEIKQDQKRSEPGGSFILIAGERRWRAARSGGPQRGPGRRQRRECDGRRSSSPWSKTPARRPKPNRGSRRSHRRLSDEFGYTQGGAGAARRARADHRGHLLRLPQAAGQGARSGGDPEAVDGHARALL